MEGWHNASRDANDIITEVGVSDDDMQWRNAHKWDSFNEMYCNGCGCVWWHNNDVMTLMTNAPRVTNEIHWINWLIRCSLHFLGWRAAGRRSDRLITMPFILVIVIYLSFIFCLSPVLPRLATRWWHSWVGQRHSRLVNDIHDSLMTFMTR